MCYCVPACPVAFYTGSDRYCNTEHYPTCTGLYMQLDSAAGQGLVLQVSSLNSQIRSPAKSNWKYISHIFSSNFHQRVANQLKDTWKRGSGMIALLSEWYCSLSSPFWHICDVHASIFSSWSSFWDKQQCAVRPTVQSIFITKLFILMNQMSTTLVCIYWCATTAILDSNIHNELLFFWLHFIQNKHDGLELAQ